MINIERYSDWNCLEPGKNPRVKPLRVRDMQIELVIVLFIFEFEIYYLGKDPLWPGVLLTSFYEPVVFMSSAEMVRGGTLESIC